MLRKLLSKKITYCTYEKTHEVELEAKLRLVNDKMTLAYNFIALIIIFAAPKLTISGGWKLIPGGLTKISKGKSGVWGVNRNDQIYSLNSDGMYRRDDNVFLSLCDRYQ